MDTADQPIILPEPPESAHRDRIRTFTVFIFILIAILIVSYSTFFTQAGNRLISPWVKNQLESLLHQPLTLETFFLDLNRFELNFTDKAHNRVQTKGNYTLFPPRIDGNYDLNLTQPDGINTLESPLHIRGTLKGTYHRLNLSGKADIFHGYAHYNAILLFAKLDSLKLKLHKVHYQPLMDLLEYPHSSDTLIDGDLTLDGLKKRDITANISLKASTTQFTSSPIIKDDNETFDFWELLADQNGKIAPFAIKAQVKVHIDELGILEQFASYPLRTSASLVTVIQGTQHKLHLKGKAKAAQGNIDSALILHKLKPETLNVDIKHADAPSLFHLFSLPAPITGKLNASAHTDFSNTAININIQKGQTQSAILKREYGITQPNILFESAVKITISPKERHYQGMFKSNLNTLRIDNSPNHDQMLQELLRQIKHNRLKGEI